MKKYTIIKDNQRLDSFIEESLQALELNPSFKARVEHKVWGRRDELVETKVISEAILDEEGNELEPTVVDTIVHPPEFTILEEDIQSEIEREEKLKQIEELEKQITPRRSREALLGDTEALAFILNIDSQIQSIRSSM